MSRIAVFVWQILGSAAMAAVLTWAWSAGGQTLHVIKTGWLGWLSRFPTKIAVWARATMLLALMFTIGDLISPVLPRVHAFLTYLMAMGGLEATHLVIGLGVIFGGFWAYQFKVKNQWAYGLVEILFAGVVGVLAAKQMTPDRQASTSLVTLIGAVYVVSRGASNCDQGARKLEVRPK